MTPNREKRPRTRPLLCLLAASLATAGLPPQLARTQVTGAEPVLGEVPIAAGFAPDPMTWDVWLGGLEEPIDVATLGLVDAASGRACGSFYIAEPATLRFVLSGGAGETPELLRLYVDVVEDSTSDPALLVRQPDGSWRCNDDGRVEGYAGIMPVIDLEPRGAGTYEVWVGSYLRELGASAVLYVSASDASMPGAGGPGWRGLRREGTGEGTAEGTGG